MRGRAVIFFICCLGAVRPLTAFAQHALDDLPVDDPTARSVLAAGESAEKKIHDNIFLVADFSKSTCYAGQQVQLDYYLYTALRSTSSLAIKPSLDGFTAKEKKPDETALPDKIVDGVHYHGFTVWTVWLTPLQAGDYSIPSLLVNNDVDYTDADGKPGHYSGSVTSKKARIHVLPLPAEGKPAAFNGAIGKWQLRSTLSTHRFSVGENDTLLIEWSGTGSFDNLAAPAIQWPEGFRHFEPVEKWDIKENGFPQSGKKTIAIPFTASTPGDYALPALSFSWFDPTTAKYQTGVAGSLPLNILPGTPAVPPPAPAPQPKVTKPVWLQALTDWWWVVAAILMIGAALTIALLRRRRGARRRIDIQPQPVAVQPKQPPITEILPNLPEGQLHLAEIKQSLITFVQSTLKTDTWAEEDLVRLLQQQDEALAMQVKPLLDECNLLLYSPNQPGPDVLIALNARVQAVTKPMNTDNHQK